MGRNKFTVAFLAEASCLASLPQVLKEIEEEHGPIIEVAVCPVHQITQGLLSREQVREALRSSNAILVDIRGEGPALAVLKQVWQETSNTVIPLLGGSRELLALLRMGSFSMQALMERGHRPQVDYRRLKQLSNVVEKLGGVLPLGALRHARNWVRCIKYWTNANRQNLKNLLLFVAREYGSIRVRVEPPVEFPEHAIFHPLTGRWHRGLGAYLAARPLDPNRPTIGLLFYGGMHFEAATAGARALAERLEPYANLVPVVSMGVLNLPAVRQYFFRRGRPLVGAVISLLWFRLNGGPLGGNPQETIELLEELDVPLFVPACMYSRDLEQWRRSTAGLSPVEIIAAVTFPELDGGIEPIPLLGLNGTVAAAIPDRADRVASRVLNRVSLRYKDNGEKRVAFIIYDYPPGEANLGSAAYLDTFASLEVILERLAQEGYRVERPRQPLKELFLGQGLVNSGQWLWPDPARSPRVPLEKYLAWFRELPEALRLAVEDGWGPPPGKIMVQGSDILLPGLHLGNVFIGVQPSRGVHEEGARTYHDRSLPPHHQYLAFYFWLRHEWRADAIVHVGTHGTLEFLPGKEVGLSGECFPDLLLADLPHFYLYHVTNPSEAMIAKRRGYATLVNHAPPPFAVAGLHGELLELEDLLDEYREARVQDPPRAARIEEKLRDRAAALQLPPSPDELHERLVEMKRAIIPCGLHVFGRNLPDDAVREILWLILRYDRPEAKSLLRLVMEAGGHDYRRAVTEGGSVLEAAERRGRQILFSYLESGQLPAEAVGLDERELVRTLGFASQVADRIRRSDELGALVAALSGGYTRPNVAGDPVRTPEVFPTGSNSYQFDPRLVPSEAACERGREVAENTLREFYRQHGRYPRSVGVVLWGFETAKTRGETVGQILAYLGVKVARGEGWYPALELIPTEELGRPRIDVVVTMCGFFRDLFPNLVTLLDQAFRLAAEQEEEQNFVRENACRALSVLRASGLDEESAARLALGRLFGPRAGEYGTNLTTLVETSRWQTRDELAEEYTASMSHLYGENVHGIPARLLLDTLLAQTELVSQVRDSHEYDFIDLDHYYEFFGGLAASVEKASGSKPQLLISDTTGEVIRTRPATEAIIKGAYTRLLNPRWVQGMLAHPFHGAQKIADRVEYLLGLAATVGVPGELFSQVARHLVFDQQILLALAENNPYACAEMLGRLLEAARRGLWNPTDSELEAVRQAYLQVEGTLEQGPVPGPGGQR